MSTTYFKLIKEPEFNSHNFSRPSEELTLTRFARAYKDGKPVPSGIQITTDKDHFLLTDYQALELAIQLLRAYSHYEDIKDIEEVQ